MDTSKATTLSSGIAIPAGQKWVERNGIIYLRPIILDDTTGVAWIARLTRSGHEVGEYIQATLRSQTSFPRPGTVVEIAIIRGGLFSAGAAQDAGIIRADAAERELGEPDLMVACLLREELTNEDLEAMGLMWIVAMHASVQDPRGDSLVLTLSSLGGASSLWGYYGDTLDEWFPLYGFAFVASSKPSDQR